MSRKRTTTHDSACRAIIDQTPDAAVAWFLMASFAYYHLDRPVISDAMFDDLCKRLLDRWGEVQHQHRHLIGRADLEAGSGFAIAREAYPARVIGATTLLLAEGPAVPPDRPVPPAGGQMALF